MTVKRYLKNMTFIFAVIISLSACEQPEDKFISHLEDGDTYFEEQDYIRARLAYKNAAQINPTDARAIYSLGLVEEAEGNLQLALSAYTTAERQDPTFLPVLIKLAEFYLKAQMPDESREKVNAILEIDPDNAQAYAISGSLYLRGRDFIQARQAAEKALSLDSANVVAYSVLAGIQFAQGNYQEAQAVLDEAIEAHPQELSFYLLKASGYTEVGDMNGLTAVYNDIFELAPDAIGYRLDLAELLAESGRKDEAAQLYRDTIERFSDNLAVKYQYFTFTERQQGIQAAEQAIDQFIARNPEMKIFSLWRANMYLRNQQLDDAIRILEQTLITDPDSRIALNASTTLADVKMKKGDIRMAQDLINQVLKQDVNNVNALLLRASMAFEQGDYESAIINLRSILTDYPDNLRAARILAEALLQQDRLDLAVDTLIQAGQSHPGDVGTLVRLAQLYAIRDNDIQAEDILSMVTERHPDNPLGWEVMARLALENNNLDRAGRSIQRLSDLEGSRITADYLRAQLMDKRGNTDQAVEIYKTIIRDHADTPLASFALSSLAETAEIEEEFRDLRAFLESMNSQDPTILTVLGTIDLALGNMTEAELSLRQAIAANPQTQAPYVSLADLLQAQGDMEQALRILEKAGEAVPSETGAAMKRAALLINQNRPQEAMAIYEAVLQQNERHATAANNLAHLIAEHQYLDRQALDEARMIAERFINSDNPYFLDTLGWIYYRQGEYAQAQSILKRAVDLLQEPKAVIDYHYGAALMALGQNEEAKTYLQRAVDSEEEFDGRIEAVELLHVAGLPR